MGTAKVIAGLIAIAIIMGGHFGFRRAQLGMAVRVGLGLLMLAIGAALGYSFIQGADDPLAHPVRLGVVVGLIGLGINQIAAPLRAAMGKPA